MKKILLLLLLLNSIAATAQPTYNCYGVNCFYDPGSTGSTILVPNSDYTATIDTGYYKICDDSFNVSHELYSMGYYGYKVNDSLYWGFTMSNFVDSAINPSNETRAVYGGGGAENTGHYGVVHGVSYGADLVKGQGARGHFPTLSRGCWVNNAAVTVRSMENGDSMAKKFGGVSGTDPDFLKLVVKGYKWGVFIDTVAFYLADYRSADSSEDYIIKKWTLLELSKFGEIDSIAFELLSSDTDSVGVMRTPAYFCIDNIDVELPGGVEDRNAEMSVVLYPNPTNDRITIEGGGKYNIWVYDIFGKLRYSAVNTAELNLSFLPGGIYFLKAFSCEKKKYGRTFFTKL